MCCKYANMLLGMLGDYNELYFMAKRRDAIDLGLNTTIGYQPTVKLAILSLPFHN